MSAVLFTATRTVTYHTLSGGEIFTFWLFVVVIGLVFYLAVRR